MPSPLAEVDPATRIERIRNAIPADGLFADKEWRLTPEPFPLTRSEAAELEKLGQRLFTFQQACNRIYLRSAKGKLPAWIANYLDAGKPARLVEHARSAAARDAVPRVIRPDLIVTEDGWSLTELDSVPGGIGLTAWLNRTYAALGFENLVGGGDGMIEGFRGILPGGADIVVSDEAGDYRPEMEWLADQLNDSATGGESWQVAAAETWSPGAARVYRFFELFDLDNIPAAGAMMDAIESGDLDCSPPFKTVLEEKLWLALFWSRPLRETWRRELRDAQFQRLQKIIPFGWVVDPAPLPHHAVIPRLELNDFRELGGLSQKERDLVLKISGFSERAWGSRGVHIGADVPQDEWRSAVDEAIATFDESPWLLQEFRKGRRVQHPFWDDESGTVQSLDARVRLCPYYFVTASPDGAPGETVKLGGVLATIVPADKKILHGMRDAVLAPCAIVE